MTRQRILEAATNSFQSLGYTRTTMQGIADAAGDAAVTLFRHFEAIRFPEMKIALVQRTLSMIELLERYFQEQIDAGTLRTINPQVTVQSLMSMLFGYAIGMHPSGGLLSVEIPIETIKNEFAPIFLANS